MARIATFRAGPSPVFWSRDLELDLLPLEDLAAVGLTIMSTLSLGLSTLVRDLLPVSNMTVAAWSKGPVLIGFTLTVITCSDPAGSVLKRPAQV